MPIPSFLKTALAANPVVLIDAGARGGAGELKRLAPWIHAYGFEPHPASFQELSLASGPYAWQQYLPLALGAKPGRQTLHLTRHPSYSSFLEVDWAVHRRHLQLMPLYEQWREALAPVGQVEVKVQTLDQVAEEQGIRHIGLLKLDTQGTELDILRGAKALLEEKRISLIKCEVSFIPFYKGQCLFEDVSRFLKGYGYVFVDCLYYPEVVHERRPFGKGRASPVEGVVERPHFAMGGDAIFYQPVPCSGQDALLTGILLAEMGYFSPAYEVLLEFSGLDGEEVGSLLRALSKPSFRQRLKKAARRWLPPVVSSWLKGE